MKRNWTMFALLAALLVPALACQTVMGALSPATPTPIVEIDLPEIPTIEVPEIPTIEVPDVTLPALPTIEVGGPVPDDIPVVDDPENLFTTTASVAYETSLAFDDVVDFYQTEMPAAGWEEVQDTFIFGDSAVLNYIQGDRVAVVTITRTGDQTSVLVGLATN